MTQIEKKLSGLRVHIDDATPALHTAIAIVGRRSLQICEECGRLGGHRGGTLDPGGPARVWTLCDACAPGCGYPA